jgi:hypothetical protein
MAARTVTGCYGPSLRCAITASRRRRGAIEPAAIRQENGE